MYETTNGVLTFDNWYVNIDSRAGQIFEIFKCFKCFKKYLKNVSGNGNFCSIENFELLGIFEIFKIIWL